MLQLLVYTWADVEGSQDKAIVAHSSSLHCFIAYVYIRICVVSVKDPNSPSVLAEPCLPMTSGFQSLALGGPQVREHEC